MKILLAILATLFLASCGKPPPMKQEAFVFGTRVELLVWGVPGMRAENAMADVLREFDRLHRAYHAWEPSELTAANQAIAAGQPHELSEELADLIRTAQTLSTQGEYLFDPGIGRIVALWGFHADEFVPRHPDPDALARLLAAKPSIAEINLDGRRLTSTDPSVSLDFGGYLKGVALDRARVILKARNIDNALVNIGGNVLALGSKGETPWRVGIQHPRADAHGGAPLAILELRDGEAIGTSGDYQRFFELDGRRFSHLIDPRTGQPAQGTQAISILIPPGPEAGMRSDVLTKPLFVAGDDWPRLAGKLGVTQALRVSAQGGIEVSEAMSHRIAFVAKTPDVRILP